MSHAVALVNARVAADGGTASSLRFGRTILGVGDPPRRGDLVVDLEGAFVLPGLVNAHDHLELNHYGALKRREAYASAADWIADLQPVLRTDPVVRRNRRFPLSARLFVGALKNLLAGVTTVAHHNPRYREIGPRFPIRVVERYGWAHSFLLERRPAGARGEPGGDVRTRCLRTPPDRPFIVHLAEGFDRDAASELARLAGIGCLRPNTVIVHGVALTPRGWRRALRCGASLVWCPASNLFLYGRTAPVRAFLDAADDAWRHLCLGTDSRLTGARDLLDELRAAAAAAAISPHELFRMVTSAPAAILRLPHGGRLAPGEPADLLVLPPAAADAPQALLRSARRDVALVTIGGAPRVGAPSLRRVFDGRDVACRPIAVDGIERIADARLARAIARCPIAEEGVAVRG